MQSGYNRFNLSHRDIEDLLTERGVIVSRAEQSHGTTGVRERVILRFKSTRQAQRFLQAHAPVYNLFNLGRHLIKAANYPNLRMSAFSQWAEVVA